MSSYKKWGCNTLSFISNLEGYVANLLEDLESQWKLFALARDNPSTIDFRAINSSQVAFKKNSGNIALYQEQIARWMQTAGESLNKRILRSLLKSFLRQGPQIQRYWN